jgi:hypothetical protein
MFQKLDVFLSSGEGRETPEDGSDPVSETVGFLVFRIPDDDDDGQSPETQ